MSTSLETEKGSVVAAQVEAAAPQPVRTDNKCGRIDGFLRVLLLATCIVSVVVMVTSKQTKIILSPLGPTPASAKFQHSPAFIYFVTALSVAGLYSIITGLASLSLPRKPKIVFILILLDVVMVGIIAAATGSAGGVGYIGLKGNKHVRWTKICNVYDKFCKHIGSSIFVSLLSAILLILLVVLNAFSLYRRIPN
ncbi:unnamed protein product [Amaranthus hypochondriacus]